MDNGETGNGRTHLDNTTNGKHNTEKRTTKNRNNKNGTRTKTHGKRQLSTRKTQQRQTENGYPKKRKTGNKRKRTMEHDTMGKWKEHKVFRCSVFRFPCFVSYVPIALSRIIYLTKMTQNQQTNKRFRLNRVVTRDPAKQTSVLLTTVVQAQCFVCLPK